MKRTFFLGGNSPSGFRSRFINQISKNGYYTYILKGGPGTGKSTLMKRIASASDDQNCDLYYCSSDIHSLDAVVLNDKKIIIADGTSPHTFDPFFPGVSQEIINLGQFWNKDYLSEHSQIIKYYSEQNAVHHKRATRYLKSAGALCDSILNTAENALLKTKLCSFTERLASGMLRSTEKCTPSLPEFKQLSAFTSYGYLTRDLPEDYTVYILNDDYFTGSDLFIRLLSEIISEHGLTAEISECSAFRDSVYEHLIIPELKTAFITADFLNKIKHENSQIINFRRFYDKTQLSQKKTHISFDKKLVTEIISSATEEIDTALSIHNELEKYYSESLDTIKLSKFTDELVNCIF